MYRVLDIFFFIFHSAVILFIVLGWIWKKTRKAHLAMAVLTALSWFVLGIWYGLGYCPCTDWHWQVRWKLGDHDLPYSYIKFLIDHLTGWDVDATMVNVITVVAFFIAFGLSILVNIRDLRARKGGHG